jgi:hypothetical protein
MWTDCISVCIGLGQFVDSNLMDYHGTSYSVTFLIYVKIIIIIFGGGGDGSNSSSSSSSSSSRLINDSAIK